MGPAPAGVKHDSDKPRYDLIPYDALEEVVEVLTYGANKYSDNNWVAGMRWSRYFSACFRHVVAWWNGEDNDPETGKSHIAHAICCLLFILAYIKRKRGTDDRPFASS